MNGSRAAEGRCVIVGGGVIGLSIAWELSRRGRRCAVIDANRIGRGTSWAGAGILPPARFDTARDSIDKLRGLSHGLHLEWAQRLVATTGIDTGFRQCGGVYLARTPGEAAALVGMASYWNEYGIDAWRLEPQDLVHRPALAPIALSPDLRGAWWVPGECQLRPPRHLRALKQACASAGVEFHEHLEIRGLDIVAGRVRGVRGHSHGTIAADQVVLCCGAWSSRFADPRGAIANVYPVRGQVVLYQGPPGMLHSVINEGNRYLVPRDDGRVYVGSNEEEVGWVEGTTPDVVAFLSKWAEGVVPALGQSPVIRTWSGLRPASFDGFPYIGRSPDVENLYLATGHYRSGLHLSCGTAVVVADLITDQPAPMDLAPFRIDR